MKRLIDFQMCWHIQAEKVAEGGDGALKAEGQAKDEAQEAEPEDLFRTLKLVSEGQSFSHRYHENHCQAEDFDTPLTSNASRFL
jgi:hypothetical protein